MARRARPRPGSGMPALFDVGGLARAGVGVPAEGAPDASALRAKADDGAIVDMQGPHALSEDGTFPDAPGPHAVEGDGAFPDAPGPHADEVGASTLSITAFYEILGSALRVAFPTEVWVCGEIQSVSVSSSGHCYMELADAEEEDNGAGLPHGAAPAHRAASAYGSARPRRGGRAQRRAVLRAVVWASAWPRIDARLGEVGLALSAGMVVRIRGEVEAYRGNGQVQLIVSALDIEQLLGRIAAARERLIRQLAAEGLLDANRALAAPLVPLSIALVGSPGTQGFLDFTGTLAASGFRFSLRVEPTTVQGVDAPASIAAAVVRAGEGEPDLVVLVRGGGSRSDLAAFDHELVARAIVRCRVPVWCGIGHTEDSSVADLVAHRACITPTRCAQDIAAVVAGYRERYLDCGAQVVILASRVLFAASEEVSRLRAMLVRGGRYVIDGHAAAMTSSGRRLVQSARHCVGVQAHEIAARSQEVRHVVARVERDATAESVARASVLASQGRFALERAHASAQRWRGMLTAYDPRRQLERGWSLTRDGEGRLVRSAASLEPGHTLTTEFAIGSAVSVVEAVSVAARDRESVGPGGRGASGWKVGGPDEQEKEEAG